MTFLTWLSIYKHVGILAFSDYMGQYIMMLRCNKGEGCALTAIHPHGIVAFKQEYNMAMMGQNGKFAGDQRAVQLLGAPPPVFS
jgi:hypothetical protein